MSGANHAKIIKALEWIGETMEGLPFGEVSVSFTVHDGTIKKIQKTVTEKSQE